MSVSLKYQLVEQLHASTRSLVHRARAADGTPLIVKIHNKPFPTFHDITRFKHEYAIGQRCRHPGVVRPLAQYQIDGRWTIIHEDSGGDALNRRLAAGQYIAPAEFFEIALQLCAALDAVHRAGIVHKDINPSNVVWNRARRHLQLIDFGIAGVLAQETQGIISPHALEGTLRYMAPEQTGRMNRSVDYRADYYALGATLYELLTGQPPFVTTDAMELVHCHIARHPDWTHAALQGLPALLPALLRRLMEKNAEQRYQTMAGLVHDLEWCRAALHAPAGVRPAAPAAGTQDRYGSFQLSQRLHGRAAQIGMLLAAFERSAGGRGEMLLIKGAPGIGKTSLVNEVHKAIAARHGCFISGKFDQYRRDVPYAPLLQALQGLTEQLLSEPEDQVAAWAARLRAALGDSLGVMHQLLPGLEQLAGPAAPPAVLPPDQAQARLSRVLQRYIQVFASASHPLVMFLDDLQWADAPTLRAIELFMAEGGNRHLLFIGAYRDNEVGAQHPLTLLRQRLDQAGVTHDTLALGPLAEADVASLAAETLRLAAPDCATLALLCHRKTGGNPFFLNQFLHTIHEAGQLRYRAGDDRWHWDLAALERADYSDNVVDLLLVKIRRLAPASGALLQLAAAVGNRFSLELLALLDGRSLWQVQQDLWPAAQAGLIQPLDQDYKYLDADTRHSRASYRFLHDRVQQAAYALAGDDERAAGHLHIARRLFQHAGAALDSHLFAIVEHGNAGRGCIGDPAERLWLAQLNLQAAQKARGTAAFQAALLYMRCGLVLLPGDAAQTRQPLWFELQLGAAEMAYLCGEYDAAEAIYPLLRQPGTTPLQRAHAVRVQAQQYQLQDRLPDAIAVLCSGLRALQIEIPDDATGLAARTEQLHALTSALCPDDFDTLLVAPEVDDPLVMVTMHMMQRLWTASYYSGRQDLLLLMVLSMTRLSMLEGNSDSTPTAYIGYAFYIALRGGDTARSQRFGAMALELARARPNLQARSLTALMFGAIINHWSAPLQASTPLYDEAFDWALEVGDFVQVGVVAAVRCSDRIILGHYLPDIKQGIERDLQLMRAHGQQAMADCCVAAALQPVKCLMGLTPRADCYDDADDADDDGFSEAAYLARHGASPLFRAYFLQGKLRNAYLFDALDAEALAGQAHIVIQMMRSQAKVPEASLYAALVWLRLARRAQPQAQIDTLLRQATAMQTNLASWVTKGAHHLASADLLLQAELARQRGDVPLATRNYQEAIDAAGSSGYIHLQALGNELCGECWLEQGQPRVAAVYLHDALARYQQWGADGKAAQLRAAHHALLGGAAARAMQSVSSTMRNVGSASNAVLDLASIVKAAQALSNEVGLHNVLQRLTALMRENSGAQAVRLLLPHDGQWRVEAEIGDDGAARVLQARQVQLDAAADPQFPLSLLRYAIRSGSELIFDNIQAAPRFSSDPYVLQYRPRSVMCLPIRQAGRLDAVLYLENSLVEACFGAERVEFLHILGAQAVISIAHARLHDSLEQRVAERTAQLELANLRLATLSSTDGLTGLANRRQFDEVLQAECVRSARSGQPLALVMLDVDHFKAYNDCYGHQGGDDCLIAVARALGSTARRASDLVARYGGEEFAMILPDTSAEAARGIGEALRCAIETLALPHERAPRGSVTVSVGVALLGAGGNSYTLIGASDGALYRAKHAGRNRVVLADDPA